jgi:hypothetical protein
MGSFAAFAVQYRAKKQQETQSSVRLADSLRDAAVAWANLSEEEKQVCSSLSSCTGSHLSRMLSSTKPYAPSREALEAHRLALKEWEESLSVEAKRALKLRRRREKGTGYALYGSSDFLLIYLLLIVLHIDSFQKHSSKLWAVLLEKKFLTVAQPGGHFRMKQKWSVDFVGINSCQINHVVMQAYKKRAAETVFGVRARRAAQHQRDMEREAKRKEAKKVKDKAHKRKEQEKKAEKAKQRKAAAAKSKREKVNA